MQKRIITKADLIKLARRKFVEIVLRIFCFVGAGSMLLGAVLGGGNVITIAYCILSSIALFVLGLLMKKLVSGKTTARLNEGRFVIYLDQVVKTTEDKSGDINTITLWFSCGLTACIDWTAGRAFPVGTPCYIIYLPDEKKVLSLYDARTVQLGEDITKNFISFLKAR